MAPATPKRKDGPRRKSDGVVFVKDSPDMGDVKNRGALSTPRRLKASMALRKKTSFYSTIDGESKFTKRRRINVKDTQTNLLFQVPIPEVC